MTMSMERNNKIGVLTLVLCFAPVALMTINMAIAHIIFILKEDAFIILSPSPLSKKLMFHINSFGILYTIVLLVAGISMYLLARQVFRKSRHLWIDRIKIWTPMLLLLVIVLYIFWIFFWNFLTDYSFILVQ